MAYTIKLGSTNKIKASTKQTAPSISISNVLLKDGCSMVNPIFMVEYSTSPTNMAKYNYVNAFGCYYFVNQVVSLNNDIWEIHCTRDPMATFKTGIGGYTGYILRTDDSSKWNTDYYDNIIAPSTVVKSSGTLTSTASGFSLGTPTIVIGTNGCGPLRSSATVDNYYYSTSRGADVILGDIFQNNDIFGIIVDLKKLSDCLTMVKAFPFAKSDTTSSSSDVYVGEYSVGVSGLTTLAVDNFSSASSHGRYYGTSCSISLASIVNSAYADYRSYDSNFVNLVLRVPFVGSIALQPWVLRFDTINIQYKVDMISGVGECMVYAIGNSLGTQTIGVYSCQVGFSIPSSSYTTDYAQIVGNVMSLNAIGSVLDAVVPPTSYTSLSNSSGASTIDITNAYLDYVIYESEDYTYGHERGKKCMAREQISNFADGSYIECLNPHPTITGATPEELDTIIGYMEGGFYYE